MIERQRAKGFFQKKNTRLPVSAFTKKTLTTASKNLLPVISDWRGQEAPGIPLQGRRGQLAFWTPFDGFCVPGKASKALAGGFNFFVSGASASGKTFFSKEMVTQTLSVGGKVVVFEGGGAFKSLCSFLGGRRISFKEEQNLSLNPFSVMPAGSTDEEKGIRYTLSRSLRSLVTQMAVPDGKADDLQIACLRQAMETVWDAKKDQATLTDFQIILQGIEEKKANTMARALAPFTREGVYGPLFHSPVPLDLSNALVVVEMDTIEASLKSLMVMAVMFQVWGQVFQTNAKTPVLILIDDAEALLQGKAVGDFIEAFAMVSRLMRCSLGVVTRSLDTSKEGIKAAWENSAWKLFFHQEEEFLSNLKDHSQEGVFVKNGYPEALLRSLRSASGFSEFALFHSEIPGIPLRFFCDPYMRALYEARSEDFSSSKEAPEQIFRHSQGRDQILAQRGTTCA